MLGSKNRMPKRARYPLFLLGLIVILVGSIWLNSQGAPASALGGVALVGMALIVSSVILK